MSSSYIKLGRTNDPARRRKEHATCDPNVKMYSFGVSDSVKAEIKLLRRAHQYTHLGGEVFQMTANQAETLCLSISKSYPTSVKIGSDKQTCCDCLKVMTIKTLNLYDGERCSKCYDMECARTGAWYHDNLKALKIFAARRTKAEIRDVQTESSDDNGNSSRNGGPTKPIVVCRQRRHSTTKTDTQPSISNNKVVLTKPTVISYFCSGITKKGDGCKRRITTGNYCSSHLPS